MIPEAIDILHYRKAFISWPRRGASNRISTRFRLPLEMVFSLQTCPPIVCDRRDFFVIGKLLG